MLSYKREMEDWSSMVSDLTSNQVQSEDFEVDISDSSESEEVIVRQQKRCASLQSVQDLVEIESLQSRVTSLERSLNQMSAMQTYITRTMNAFLDNSAQSRSFSILHEVDGAITPDRVGFCLVRASGKITGMICFSSHHETSRYYVMGVGSDNPSFSDMNISLQSSGNEHTLPALFQGVHSGYASGAYKIMPLEDPTGEEYYFDFDASFSN